MKSRLSKLALLLAGTGLGTTGAHAGLSAIDLPGDSESYHWSLNRANYPPDDFESADDWTAFSTNQPDETDVFVRKTGANFIYSVEDSVDGLYGRNGTLIVSDTAPPAGLETVVLQLDYAIIAHSFAPGSAFLAPILKIGGVPLGGDGRADTFLGNDTTGTSPFPSSTRTIHAGQYTWQWDLRDLGGLDLSAGYTIEWATPASGTNGGTVVALLAGIRLDQSATYTQVATDPATYAVPPEPPARDVAGPLPPPTGNPNLIENGSFETLTPYLEFLLENAENYQAAIPATDPTDPGTAYLPGWIVLTAGINMVQPPQTWSQAPVPDGNNYLGLSTYQDQFGRTSNAYLARYLWLEAGVTYRLSFDVHIGEDWNGRGSSERQLHGFALSGRDVNGNGIRYYVDYDFVTAEQWGRVSERLRNTDKRIDLMRERVEFYLTDSFAGEWETRWIEFTPLVTDEYYFVLGYRIDIDNLSLTVVSEPDLRLVDQWRLDHFAHYANLGDAANTADPDGDGLSNLLEYALRRDPFTADGSNGMTVGQTGGTDKYATLTFGRRADPDLAYTVEATDDLEHGSWDPIFHSNDPSPLDGDSDTLVVEDHVILASNQQRFFRLSVETTAE